jgi:hypothetical protein
MSNHNPKPRRNYLINPGFQWAMIRYAVLISILNSSIFFLAGSEIFERLVEAGIRRNLGADSDYFQVILQEKSRLILIFGLTGFLSVCLITIFGIVMSHRIAGPLYRLSRYLRNEDPSKPLPELRFREKDFFQDLARDFNLFRSRIKTSDSPQE